MERRSLGRDLGLSVRMAVALVLMAVRAEKLPALREPQEPATRNPRVLAAFICAALYWCFVAAFLLGADPFQAAIPVAAVWIAGVVLAIQAVGRASRGAPGMGFAIAALAGLVGPWALGIVGFFVVFLVAPFVD